MFFFLSPVQTKAEKKIVESYGGEIVFSPGDFVLSSSALIENDPPNIAIEKLMLLMQAEDINFDDLRNSLSGLENLSVEIVGDLIVDSLTTASIIGGYRKTPTPSVRVEKFEKFVSLKCLKSLKSSSYLDVLDQAYCTRTLRYPS